MRVPASAALLGVDDGHELGHALPSLGEPVALALLVLLAPLGEDVGLDGDAVRELVPGVEEHGVASGQRGVDATGRGPGHVEGDEEAGLALLPQGDEAGGQPDEQLGRPGLALGDQREQLGQRRVAGRLLGARPVAGRLGALVVDGAERLEAGLDRARVLAPRDDVELALVGTVVAVAVEEGGHGEPAVGQLEQVGRDLVLVGADAGQQAGLEAGPVDGAGQLAELVGDARADEGGEEVQHHHVVQPAAGVAEHVVPTLLVEAGQPGQRRDPPRPQLGHVGVVALPQGDDGARRLGHDRRVAAQRVVVDGGRPHAAEQLLLGGGRRRPRQLVGQPGERVEVGRGPARETVQNWSSMRGGTRRSSLVNAPMSKKLRRRASSTGSCMKLNPNGVHTPGKASATLPVVQKTSGRQSVWSTGSIIGPPRSAGIPRGGPRRSRPDGRAPRPSG